MNGVDKKKISSFTSVKKRRLILDHLTTLPTLCASPLPVHKWTTPNTLRVVVSITSVDCWFMFSEVISRHNRATKSTKQTWIVGCIISNSEMIRISCCKRTFSVISFEIPRIDPNCLQTSNHLQAEFLGNPGSYQEVLTKRSCHDGQLGNEEKQPESRKCFFRKSEKPFTQEELGAEKCKKGLVNNIHVCIYLRSRYI